MSENFIPSKDKLYPEIYVDNFRELLDSIYKYSSKNAFCFKNPKTNEIVKITYKQYIDDIIGLSSKFLSLGLAGKRIAIISHNKYPWPVSYMAIQTGGMIGVPLDYQLPINEIELSLIRSNAEAIIFEEHFIDTFKKIRENGKTNLKYYICMELNEDTDGFLSFQKLVDEGRKLVLDGNDDFSKVKIDSNKMSVLLFTSGTTGQSKIVMLSQRNICSNVSAMTTLIKMRDDDNVLSFLPLHHTFECTATFLYCNYTGCTICYADSIKQIPKNLLEYDISGVVCVPALLEIVYRQVNRTIKAKELTIPFKILIGISNFLRIFHIDIRRKAFKSIYDSLGHKLRLILYGAASVDKKVIKFFENIGIVVVGGYGLTETSPVIACENDKYRSPGSVGFPLFCEEVKIDNPDENGNGEILVKGPNVMLGYYENEEATKEIFEGGWLHTGDIGKFDKKGFLYITGRIKDMIVLENGKKVFPHEIESLLNNSDLITESFVYTKRENKNLKLGVKLVYSEDNEALKGKTKDEIFNMLSDEVKKVNNEIPKYKHIQYVTITTTPFKKTSTQKIKRFEEMKHIDKY